ncbi:MAG: oligopeptidase A [Deltaproteobacteria bacterium]|nr:oligopeptidase A [Deltaproteobacteria bacterium]
MHPFLVKEERISWSKLTAENVIPDITKALERAQEEVNELIGQEPRTYEGCFVAFEDITDRLTLAWRKVGHLASVCDSEAFRQAMATMLPKVSVFIQSLYLNDGLWKCVDATYQAEQTRTGVTKRHMEEVREQFIQNGAQLEGERKTELAKISKELAEITKEYSNNVLDSTNGWELIITDESELVGLPESALQAAKQSAKSKGLDGWRFTLHVPSRLPVLKHSSNEALREAVWRAGGEIGRGEEHNNLPLVVKILSLRKRQAQLLGHSNFPDLILSQRMAKTGQNALSFVEDLHGKVKEAFADEVGKISSWVSEKTGKEGKLAPWSFDFYAEKLRKELYDFDSEELRPYFPIDSVLKGLFSIIHDLYGVRIEERSSRACAPDEECPEGVIEVWHESVRAYSLFDKDETEIGFFYTDWFPRESKRAGAWMNPLFSGQKKENGTFSLNVGLVAGNMTAPIGDKPALMTHREVETIFHEFGHLLHHLFGRVSVPALNGTDVAWDFVELPSQIMENWCWETEALHRFARHYETGAVLPDELVEKLKRAKNFHSAYGTMRQLSFGKLDLELHMQDVEWDEQSIDANLKEILDGYLPDLSHSGPSMVTRFGHLFSHPVGYAGGYYSYKWAEVLDADAFSRFANEGIFSREVGQSFRDTILSQGNSAPADELFVAFMGREPDANALLVRSGLL